MSHKIEQLISAGRWTGARAAILAALDAEPSSRWLLARLALTYYEQRQYSEALEIAEQARRLAPRCPLVLWEFAGALHMLGRRSDAIRVYQRLVGGALDRSRVVSAGRAWPGHAD